jgi:hypothetical protein
VLPPSKEALDMSLGDIDYIASGSIDNRACCEAHWMPPSVEEASLLKLEAAVYNVIEETASEDHNIQGSQCVKVLARLACEHHHRAESRAKRAWSVARRD